MTAVVLIVVLLALLGLGAGALVVARRRPGLRPTAGPARNNDNDPLIDPFAVSEPWRQYMQHALHAREQFRFTLRAARRGPLRAQLVDIGAALDGGVDRAWATAQHGHRLSQARGRIDTDRLSTDLSHASTPTPPDSLTSPGPNALQVDNMQAEDTQAAGMGSAPPADDDAIGRSLRAQLDAAQRLDAVIGNAAQQLRLLTTQLDEAVARAAELAARAGTSGALEAVAADITRASDQLEALRLALEETERL